MKNLVIVGISDTADRIIRFIERYHLFNILGCTVNKQYMPEDEYAFVGGGQIGKFSLSKNWITL